MALDSFLENIRKFNDMYKLPSNNQPTLLDPERISNFQNILQEEIGEGDDILQKYQDALQNGIDEKAKQEILTDMSDWLGDIIVYCASEARRWGLPTAKILDIIMESNFSKLDENGQPIYDDRGKVMKGPNYWKPEPKILEHIKDL